MPDPVQPQGRERRASSFLNKIFRRSTANAMESLAEEPKKEEPKQQQPYFVLQLQEKIAQIRYVVLSGRLYLTFEMFG